LNSAPPLFFCILPPPIPETVSAGIIFAFTYMCTHFLHHVHPPISFPHHLLHNSATSPLTAGPVPPSFSQIL
jgi:hypothetical protein